MSVSIIITVVMILLFAVAYIKGFAMVLEIFYGFCPVSLTLIAGLAVAVSVTLGGLSAVIATDVIQFICLSLFILTMTCVVMSCVGGIADMSCGQILTTAPEE